MLAQEQVLTADTISQDLHNAEEKVERLTRDKSKLQKELEQLKELNSDMEQRK